MTLKPLSQRLESPYLCPSCQQPMPGLHRYRRVLQKRRLDTVLRKSLQAHRTAASAALQELQALSKPGKTGVAFLSTAANCAAMAGVCQGVISQLHVPSWQTSTACKSCMKVQS